MSGRPPSPHDFLLHLRSRAPALARRLDGIGGLELARGELRIRAPEGGWSWRELGRRRGAFREEVRRFFGPGTQAVLVAARASPEALPFPVAASKVWNHVAFWVWDRGRSGALVVRKPRYGEAWLPAAAKGSEGALCPQAEPEVVWLEEALPAEARAPAAVLPLLLDELAALAREASSYAHLVASFPGDRVADELESRLYGVKEWGTPRTPAPLLQKYVGRLHYADPRAPLLGLRLARRLLSQPDARR